MTTASRGGFSDTEFIHSAGRYAVLRLGLACNVECPFCNVPAESYPYPVKLSKKQIDERLEEFRREGLDALDFSGGEPTLRPDLPALVRLARAKGFRRVGIQTNAVLIGDDPSMAGRLKEAGLTHACASLHSHIPKVHDLLVKQEGAFGRCLAGIDALLDAGVAVVLDPVITIANFRTLPAYMDFVAERLPRTSFVSLIVVQPHGRAFANRGLLPRYGELSAYVEKALEIAESRGLVVNNPYCGLPLCVGGWHKRLERSNDYLEARLGRPPGDREKFKPAACGSCDLNAVCGGVWKEYPGIHPIEDLRPIRLGARL